MLNLLLFLMNLIGDDRLCVLIWFFVLGFIDLFIDSLVSGELLCLLKNDLYIKFIVLDLWLIVLLSFLVNLVLLVFLLILIKL